MRSCKPAFLFLFKLGVACPSDLWYTCIRRPMDFFSIRLRHFTNDLKEVLSYDTERGGRSLL